MTEDAPPWDDAEAAVPESGEERDDKTFSMFGDEPAAIEASPEGAAQAPAVADAAVAAPLEPPGDYQVLARKYRPRRFEDLIGQEAMVRTLTNAFSSGRIAHAFMLTGVRGVGKTTTARLLARALNYESDTVHQPSVDLSVEGRHCRAIIEGRHMDVLEMDAASRTKVDEMRELLDSVRYSPVEARYKVYIIDEVHMLSTAAFNALLKTLEEPPPHAKFIFATTEIRKVPVTILSRCQRFDLRRVEPEVLIRNLKTICQAEGALVEEEGLILIARAAEGSVRDGQSLLDQAIVQVDRGQTVTAAAIRDMLGLADRAQTIALFEEAARGQTAEALKSFRTLYNFGADPAVVMLDLLEHAHGAAVAKALGPDALTLPKDQAARLAAIGSALSAGTLSRLWQMLLKAYEEARRAPDPAAACEMALIRLCYAADLPGPEEALKAIQSGEPPSAPARGPSSPSGGGPSGSAAMARAMTQPQSPPMAVSAEPQIVLQSFEDVVALIEARRDIVLKLDVAKYVRPISFRPGAIEFEPAPGAPGNLSQRLAVRLKEWTGQPWLVAAQGGGGAESLYEREQREKAAELQVIAEDPFVKSVLTAFPGTEIVAVRTIVTDSSPADGSAEAEDDED
ncbi:MAG: DNA polymerase III subunit gamma/tau [Caulobacteraceae bacterium]